MPGKKPRNAVYLVTVPDEFHPQRPWDIPACFAAAELVAKNVAWPAAIGFTRVFNKGALERGLPDRKWAVAVGHARYRWRKGHARYRSRKGGAV